VRACAHDASDTLGGLSKTTLFLEPQRVSDRYVMPSVPAKNASRKIVT
jgi:hypothetical protein